MARFLRSVRDLEKQLTFQKGLRTWQLSAAWAHFMDVGVFLLEIHFDSNFKLKKKLYTD